ncbi:hypothetical protein DFAR_1110020 [Desulfarculales bacterium]
MSAQEFWASQNLQSPKDQTTARPGRRDPLLLASYLELAAANKRAKEFSAEGVDSRVESMDLGPQGRWYRVLHGQVPERKQVEKQGDKLRKVGGIAIYTVLAR